MTTLTILDGNCLLGQHLVEAAKQRDFHEIRVWNSDSKLENRLYSNNNLEDDQIQQFIGLDSLENALNGAEIVINAHELRDFSISSDKNKLDEINYQFVEKVAELCQKLNVTKIIQVSSVYLQCSTMWPNVHGREVEGIQMTGMVPFKPFIESKNRAEQVVKNLGNDFQVVIARIGELFGEGDVKSPICDAILLSEKLKFLPIFGDCQGIIQMSYAKNIAHFIIEIGAVLSKRPEIKYEIVCLRDETPNRDIYSTCLIPFVVNKTRPIGERQVPFFFIFMLLGLATILSKILNFVGISSFLDQLPDPVYFYFLFRHWTFLDDFKQKIFFGMKPKFSYSEAKEKSANYYQHLKVDQIEEYSWRK